jgi:outer membrane protein
VVCLRVAANHGRLVTRHLDATMASLYRSLLALSVLATALAARGQVGPSTAAEAPLQAASAPAPAPAASAPRQRFEGALGLVLSHEPAFSGSSQRELKVEPAGFLRWGRITLSGSGGFTTRAKDDVERGLDALLLRRPAWRVNLSLRFDRGRRESESSQLEGLGDIRSTLRARLGVRWEPAPSWQLSLGSSFDLLDRVGGLLLTAGVSRSFQLDQRQRVTLGASISGAADGYLQTWYGVTPQQSAASGYPVYRAGDGLRDVSVSATWRKEFSPQWAGFASVGASRLLGPAADSPLAHRRGGASASLGLARRF